MAAYVRVYFKLKYTGYIFDGIFCPVYFVRFILSGIFSPGTFCPVYFDLYVLSRYVLSGIFCPGIISPGIFSPGLFCPGILYPSTRQTLSIFRGQDKYFRFCYHRTLNVKFAQITFIGVIFNSIESRGRTRSRE